MISYLLRTEKQQKATHIKVQRVMQGLGIEIAQCRSENMGLTMGQLGRVIGLDSGFICLLEEGMVMPLDITPDVRKCLRKIKGFKYDALD